MLQFPIRPVINTQAIAVFVEDVIATRKNLVLTELDFMDSFLKPAFDYIFGDFECIRMIAFVAVIIADITCLNRLY